MGTDVLPDDQKLLIETARAVRVGFLQQNAYHKDDTYVPLDKQYRMMKLITDFYALAKKSLSQGVNVDKIIGCGWIEKLIKVKYDIPNDKIELFDDLYHSIACKAAIKANDTNSGIELQALVNAVYGQENIRYCPHGRPVMITLTKRDIEKQFRRVL